MIGVGKMSYIKSIRENVNNAIETTKIAFSKNINYSTAIIMFHNGRNDVDQETALGMTKILKELNIPLKMVDVFDLVDDYQTVGDRFNLEFIYCKIAKYANRDYISDLSRYMNSDYNYGKKIYNLMKQGIPIDMAIQIFEIRVNYEMKRHGLSEIAALAKILFFKNNISATLFADAYQNNRAYTYNPYKTVKDAVLSSNKFKKKAVYGIILVSKTGEGIQRLENLIEYVYANGDSDFLELLSLEAEKNKLFVSDVSLLGEINRSHYHRGLKYIYMSNTENSKKYAITFYHEATHFLDNSVAKITSNNFDSYFSIANPRLEEFLQKIRLKKDYISRGLGMTYFEQINTIMYVNDPVLNKKWLQQIKEEHPDANDDIIKLFMQQKKLYERRKYKILYRYLTDIYDGLSKGKLTSFFGVSGHGMKYYSNYENVFIEFFANIGLIYNSGDIDILVYEFGEEIANELVDMYKNFIVYGIDMQSSKRAI